MEMKTMKYDLKEAVALSMMIWGVIIAILALLFNIQYWDLATLIFLIGLVISDLSAHQYLKKYRKRYGDLE